MHVSRLLIIGTAATLTVGLAAAPATAAATDDTIVTFTIVGGTLDILSAAAVNLGNVDRAAPFGGPLGDVVVTDSRASADASWLASVTSTDFVTQGGDDDGEVILAAEVDYWSGPATVTTGNGTFTPGQATAAAATALDVTDPLTAFTHTGGTGNNSATWDPTLIITAGLENVAGTYTGTVTLSVG